MSETLVLVLTDVVDSTRLNDELGDAVMAPLWAEHDRQARELVRLWHGREVGRSDGFLLLFEAAADALGFASAYQHALAALPVPMKARVGLHAGEVKLRENAEADRAQGATPFEVDGLALPAAARVMSAAEGGQTLLSAQAVQALQGWQSAKEWRCTSIGHWRLKGLHEPIELFLLVEDGVPAAPPADSTKAYRVVRDGGSWLPARELPHSLPAERNRFIGREAALRTLAEHFEHGARLVTLAGMGGIGKTRLAQRYARMWLGDYPGGAWFCDLSPARSVDGVLHAVAQGLSVPLGRADPVHQLGAAIAGRGHCLVILDNFEQVAAHAEGLLGHWLETAPQARFLVTSREVLGVVGEQVQTLAPLDAADATSMFRQRVHAVGVEPQFAEDDEAALPPLMELLDRLPLAIELAAARVRLMPPSTLLSRMRDRFQLLAARSGRNERQATIRATLDWSWALLTPTEQSALAQLSVFEGGFTLAAAEAVVDLSAFRFAPEVVNVVQALVEKSLVRDGEGRRFSLLVTVQEYAAEQCLAHGALQAQATSRHATYFAGLHTAASGPGLGADLDNLITATRRAAAAGQVAVAVDALQGTWSVLRLRGPFRVGVELAESVRSAQGHAADGSAGRLDWVHGWALKACGRLEEAAERLQVAIAASETSNDAHCRGHALSQLGDVHVDAGRVEEGRKAQESAIEIARVSGDQALECQALMSLGNLHWRLGDLDGTRGCYVAALQAARVLDDRRWEGGVLGNLGVLNVDQGRLADGEACCAQSLQIARALGDRQWEGNALSNLGLLHHLQQRYDQAAIELETALKCSREIGHVRLECVVLTNLGMAVEAANRPDVALVHFEAALRVARGIGDQRAQGQVLGYLGGVHARQRRFDIARASLQSGQQLLESAADRLSLALLRCTFAECEHLAHQQDLALELWQLARSMADEIGVEPDSELRRALARVARLLESPAVA